MKNTERLDVYVFATILVSGVIAYYDSITTGLVMWFITSIPVFMVMGYQEYLSNRKDYSCYTDETTSKIIKHAIKKDMITTEHIDMAVYSACAVAYTDAYDKYKEIATKKQTMFGKLKNAALEIHEAPMVAKQQKNFERLNTTQEVVAAPVEVQASNTIASGTKVKYDLDITASGYQLKEGAINKELISFDDAKMVETEEELNAMPSQDVTAYSDQEDRIIYFLIDYGKALVEYK